MCKAGTAATLTFSTERSTMQRDQEDCSDIADWYTVLSTQQQAGAGVYMPDVEVLNSPGRPLSWQSCPRRGLASARAGRCWVTDPLEQLQLGGVCLS